MRTDGRSDMTKATAASRNFANALNNTRIFILSAGSEPAIPAIKRMQTYALERTATGIG